jgi:hypothetical protein
MPDEFQQIYAMLTEMKSGLDVHIAASKDRDGKVDDMYKALIVGNGVPSIKQRVARLEEHMPDREDWLEVLSWIKKEQRIAWIVIAGVITQTLILIFQLIKSGSSLGM